MNARSRKNAVNRRQFLTKTGSGLAAAAVLPSSAWSAISESSVPSDVSHALPHPSPSAGAKKKIPIGVFDPVYENLSLDEMLDKVAALGLEAMEIGTGGYPGTNHCPVAELLADPAKAKAWKKKFEDHNLRVATFSCHGNPIHPDPKHAAKDVES